MTSPRKVRMWVLFGSFSMFSNYCRLHIHNETCIALASTNINQNENWTSPYFTWLSEEHIYWLISTKYIRISFNCVDYRVGSSIAFEGAVQSLLNICLHGVCILFPHKTQHQLSRCSTKKQLNSTCIT